MQQLYERALFDPGCEEVKELETEEPNRTDCFYGYFLFEFPLCFPCWVTDGVGSEKDVANSPVRYFRLSQSSFSKRLGGQRWGRLILRSCKKKENAHIYI